MQLLGSFQQKITALPEKFKKGCHGIRRVLRFKVKVGSATYTFSHCMVQDEMNPKQACSARCEHTNWLEPEDARNLNTMCMWRLPLKLHSTLFSIGQDIRYNLRTVSKSPEITWMSDVKHFKNCYFNLSWHF